MGASFVVFVAFPLSLLLVVERRVFVLLLEHDGPGSVRLSLGEGFRGVLFYGLTGLQFLMGVRLAAAPCGIAPGAHIGVSGESPP
jgi:hypothetical protein